MKFRFPSKIKLWVIVSVFGLGLLRLGQQAVLVWAGAAASPTVTVISPNGAAADTVGEGDDYFTQVLNEPRDMNQYSDMKWQEFGVTNIQDSNGIWSATASSSNSRVWPLYPGVSSNPTGGANDASAAEIGKTGWNYPVQTTKYKLLSFRVNSSTTPNQWTFAYSNYSNTVENGSVAGQYNIGWQVYTVTLPWGPNPAYGLAYRFGSSAPATYQVDWIRLTDPTTSPTYNITFAVNNTQAGDVVNLECYTSNQIVNANYCGRIASAIPVNSPGTYHFQWRTAYLVPGSYYVLAVVVRSGATTASGVSNGPLTIQPAPLLQIDAPSMTSGPDYATDVLGHPWDMSDASSIFTSADLYRKPHDFAAPCPCFANGELYGTVGRYDPADPSDSGDPFVYLNVKRTNPINTAKYKYLTYRYKIDRSPWWSNSSDRLSFDSGRQVYPAGWLVRGIFFGTFPPDVVSSSNTTNDLVVFDDWNTYQMDLSKGVARGYWEPSAPETGGYWTGLKYEFRFDFLEGVDPWNIHLDYVTLTGDDTANASYTVRWSKIGGSNPTTIDFYASQNQSSCLSGGSLIYHWQPAAVIPPAGPYRIYLPLISGSGFGGPTSFVWNTATVTPATYYICGRVSDGVNTTTMVSNAAIVISH